MLATVDEGRRWSHIQNSLAAKGKHKSSSMVTAWRRGYFRIFVPDMPRFYPLRVARIVHETPSAVSLYLEVPESLRADFAYEAGQYLTIKHRIQEGEILRHYSLSSAPGQGVWRIGVKDIGRGGFSAYANRDLKVGASLLVAPPEGGFTNRYKPAEKRTLLFFAAGSGITPILSLIQAALIREKGTQVFLFYANRSAAETLYRVALVGLAAEQPRFKPYFFYTRDRVRDAFYQGRLDRHKLALIINQLVDFDETDEAFICGPQPMIAELAQGLLKQGLPSQHIHFELFSEPVDPFFLAKKKEVPRLEKATVVLELEGETYEFEMNPQAESVLDAALDRGIDAPYSCKGGVCSSCECLLKKGEVELKHNLVLTDADLQAGEILACQAHPTTAHVEIEFR